MPLTDDKVATLVADVQVVVQSGHLLLNLFDARAVMTGLFMVLFQLVSGRDPNRSPDDYALYEQEAEVLLDRWLKLRVAAQDTHIH